MIERGHFNWEISCDSCSHQADLSDTDVSFQTAWAEANGDGWTATKKDGEWVHTCPTCNEETGFD